MWYITLIVLHILKNPCTPGINSTWSWCMGSFSVLLDLVYQYFVVDFCIYAHQWYWPVILFLISLILAKGWWWSHRMSLGVFLPLQFFWNFQKVGVNSSLNVWKNSYVKLSAPGLLFIGSFLITYFILVLVTASVHIFCHSLLACRFSAEKSANNLMAITLYVICCF